MAQIDRITETRQLKVLADENRMNILRLLLAGEATLSQLGAVLGRHPAWVRHHVKRLEEAGLVALSRTAKVGGYVEKYYETTSSALEVRLLLTPASAAGGTVVAMGSDDPALDLLSSLLRERQGPQLLALSVGSLDGLIALRQGTSDIAGCHLFDPGQKEFNVPFVKHLFCDQDVVIVTFANREQGLLVRPGDPHRISRIEDLARGDVTLINRRRGSGTRLWLDQRLRELEIPHDAVRGYDREAPGHAAAAAAVAAGQADVAIGIQAAAQRFELGFIPLFSERYDLVMSKERASDPRLTEILEQLGQRGFQRAVGRLAGYDMARSGDMSVVEA
jgi:molybdate-binding protein/DNA-binding HxlR family transcriptional regulator